jgi:hypothetical protein
MQKYAEQVNSALNNEIDGKLLTLQKPGIKIVDIASVQKVDQA